MPKEKEIKSTKRFKCPACNQLYISDKGMKEHYRRYHKNAEGVSDY